MANPKRRSKGKANGKAPERDPYRLYTAIIPVPVWRSREDALAYLDGEFGEWCNAIGDLLSAGVAPDPILMTDLWLISQHAAGYIQAPGPMISDAETLNYLGALARMLDGLGERTNGALEIEKCAGSGLPGACLESTPRLLAETLAHGAAMHKRETRRWLRLCRADEQRKQDKERKQRERKEQMPSQRQLDVAFGNPARLNGGEHGAAPGSSAENGNAGAAA